MASTTDLIFPALGVADGSSGIAGRVEPPQERAVIEVRSRAGFPVTELATETQGPEAGRFHATLAPGDYTLVLRAAQRPDRRLEVTVAPGAVSELPPQTLEPLGFLRFEPAFADGGPGRVIVDGRAADARPGLRRRAAGLSHRRRAGEQRHRRRASCTSSEGPPIRCAWRSPPGRYRLIATRGLEYGLEPAPRSRSRARAPRSASSPSARRA